MTQASALKMGVTSLCPEPGRRTHSSLCQRLRALLNPDIPTEVHRLASVCSRIPSRREALLGSFVFLAWSGFARGGVAGDLCLAGGAGGLGRLAPLCRL